MLILRKPVFWMGSSKDDLRGFLARGRRDVGYQLEKVQRGEAPTDWKAIRTVGSAVREIRVHAPEEDRSGRYCARSGSVQGATKSVNGCEREA